MDKFNFGYDLYRYTETYKMNFIKKYIYIY